MTKAERTKELRYKRPALHSLGYDTIQSELGEILEACQDIHWYIDNDEDTLLNALDGDEEDEFEFKMAFADLEAKADRLMETLYEFGDREEYDDCTVALIGNRYRVYGYDYSEEDYYSLCGYEERLATTDGNLGTTSISTGKTETRHTIFARTAAQI